MWLDFHCLNTEAFAWEVFLSGSCFCVLWPSVIISISLDWFCFVACSQRFVCCLPLLLRKPSFLLNCISTLLGLDHIAGASLCFPLIWRTVGVLETWLCYSLSDFVPLWLVLLSLRIRFKVHSAIGKEIKLVSFAFDS